MRPRATIGEELAAVAQVAADLGIAPVAPAILCLANNTIVHLAPQPLVARVRSADDMAQARLDLAREVAVTTFLAERHAPVVRPARTVDPGPHVAGRSAMSLWTYAAHRPTDEAEAAADALRRVHAALSGFGGTLPRFTAPIDACGALLAARDRMSAMADEDQRLLAALHRRLRSALDGHHYRAVPIHGDAHLGNVLLSDEGPLWGDFESACLGPREWDVACLPACAWPLFDDIDPALLRCLADLRSVCVATWCWADHGRSAAVDEAAAYHLADLRQRFGGR